MADSSFTTYAKTLLRPALLALYGETISYTVHGSAAASITAIVHRETQTIDEDEYGRQALERLTITVSTADVTPTLDDTCTIDTTSYAVASIDEREGGMADLTLVRPVRREASRAGLRTSPSR